MLRRIGSPNPEAVAIQQDTVLATNWHSPFPPIPWKRTGIKAPTLYPRDSEIKEKKLDDAAVQSYMQAQRAHQNNVEFTSVYMAVFLATGLVAGDLTMKVALAGASVLGFRVVNGLGYAYGGAKHPLKRLGGLFHIGEVYTLYLAGSIAYRMVQ